MTEAEGARRSTRAALAEIPLRLGQLRVSPPHAPAPPDQARAPPHTPRHALTAHAHHLQELNTPTGAASSAFMSPTPSPDELVIQQRGRRKLPVVWSPDIDYKKYSPFQSSCRTPPKSGLGALSPSKNGIVLRSTPRKRLLMIDPDNPSTPEKTEAAGTTTTPQKTKNQTPTKLPSLAKRLKIEKKANVDDKAPLEVVLKGMSHEQLIDIIKGVTQKHPEVEQLIRKDLPAPDLRHAEEKLIYLKSNIFKSLPTSRLYSKTDSPSYSRVATHVVAFKKQLIDQGRILAESQHWHSVMEYVLMSWGYVKATPLWDIHAHNTARRQCFKFLAALCATALRKGNFERTALMDVQDKLENMISDCDEIQSCLMLLQVQIGK